MSEPRIYTKLGDDGSTGLLFGGRTSKADPLIETLGCIDETVAALRQRTIRNAFHAAQSAFAAVPSLERFGVSVRPGGTGAAVFTGEIERASLGRVTDAGDASQMLAAFSSTWWNPDPDAPAPDKSAGPQQPGN